MTEEEAFNYVSLYSEPRRDPIVLDSELSVILTSHKRSDSSWDLDWAILDTWKLKLGRCSDYYDVTVGGRDHAASQVSQHCREMVQLWEKRANVSLEMMFGDESGEFMHVANYNDPLP